VTVLVLVQYCTGSSTTSSDSVTVTVTGDESRFTNDGGRLY
jgi:hypothetical protein